MLNVLYDKWSQNPIKKYYIKYLKFEMSINKLLDKKILISLDILFPLTFNIFPFHKKKTIKNIHFLGPTH